MPRRTDTRNCVIRTTAELLRKQGYRATGLNQILAESGAPKGSLYFHFPGGKEQLAAESVTLAGQQLHAAITATLAGADDPATGCARLAEAFTQLLIHSDFAEGCPVATVALEAASDSEPIRLACADSYALWLREITNTLLRWGVSDDRAADLADFVLSSVEGALLLARVRRDTTVIDGTARQLTEIISAARQ